MKNSIKLTSILLIGFGLLNVSLAQNVGINSTGATPNSTALLDIDATDKGILIPRVSLSSTADVTTVTSPATNLLVFNTNSSMTNGNGAGFYYYNGSSWTYMVAPSNGPGASGEVLTSQGGGNAPEWASTGGSCLPTEVTNELDGSGNPCSGTACGTSAEFLPCINMCLVLNYNGNSDWRMPKRDELVNLRDIMPGNTSSNYVWSVSNISSSTDWPTIRMSDLNKGNSPVSSPRWCRCVR